MTWHPYCKDSYCKDTLALHKLEMSMNTGPTIGDLIGYEGYQGYNMGYPGPAVATSGPSGEAWGVNV